MLLHLVYLILLNDHDHDYYNYYYDNLIEIIIIMEMHNLYLLLYIFECLLIMVDFNEVLYRILSQVRYICYLRFIFYRIGIISNLGRNR